MPNNTTHLFLQPPSFSLYEVHLFVLTAIGVLSPVAVVTNALVLAAIWRNSSLRTTSYILLAGLAFTDFCTGLISQPLWIVNGLIHLDLQFSSYDKNTQPTFYFMTKAVGDRCVAYFYQTTALLITLMSLERWLLMSRRRSLLTVRCVSFIAAALLILMLPSALILRHEANFITISIALFCIIVTSVAYFKVFRIIRQHQQQIQVTMASQNAAQPTINFVKYKKSVFSILYILSVFYIGYVPLIITISLKWTLLKNNVLGDIFMNISILLVFSSSSTNPLIVLWRMKDIRDEVIRLLKRITCKSNQVQ
ncbi:hypothetical protein ACROYT_G035306 [Oculina patagonica]